MHTESSDSMRIESSEIQCTLDFFRFSAHESSEIDIESSEIHIECSEIHIECSEIQ